MKTDEYFTLETLIEFYTDSAKAGGIESVCGGYWSKSGGPNLNCKVSHYRLKPAPAVRYFIKCPDDSTSDRWNRSDDSISDRYWTSYEDAAAWLNTSSAGSLKIDAKIIKFVEEV